MSHPHRRPLAPHNVVASFDSATVMRASLAAALKGQPFPHLGHSSGAALAVRVGGRLPWPILRWVYTRIGASEGINPHRLADVDMAAVAQWLANGYPQRRYAAVLIGSSNGALIHLAAALQVPWLPGTVLVPVARTGDPHRPVMPCVSVNDSHQVCSAPTRTWYCITCMTRSKTSSWSPG
jgi:hypothetical protein